MACIGDVVELKTDAGTTFSFDTIKSAVEQHKPAVLFLCQVRLSVEPALYDTHVPTSHHQLAQHSILYEHKKVRT